MGIKFSIDTEAGVVYTVGRGTVTFDDVVEFRKQLISHTDYNKNYYHLVDYREAIMNRSADEAKQLAIPQPLAKVAVVAGKQAFPFVRMIHGWKTDDEPYMVFQDMASARVWLGLPSEEDT